MKLSEQLTLRNMAGEKVSGFDFDKALELEAEVERLRDADDCVTRMGDACDRHCEELDAYRAAVAELRQALINDDCGDIGVCTRAVMLTFLDKLPKSEP